MKRIRNFVIHTFKDVPKEQRQEIVERVTQSLIEKVEDLQEKGYTLDQAVDKTVLEFGDANDFFLPIDKPRTLIQHVKSIREYRNDLLFSVFGALIIIGMLVFTNLQYTSGIIWFVLPSLAVLWWPLAVLYRFLNKKEGDKKE